MKRRIFDRNNSYTVAWGFVESKDGLIESPQVCKGYRFQDTEIRGISAFQGPFAWIIYSSKRLHEKKKNGNLPGILRYHAISLRLVRNSCNFQSRLNLKILRSEKPTATYHLNLFLCIFRNSVKLSKNLLPSKHLQHHVRFHEILLSLGYYEKHHEHIKSEQSLTIGRSIAMRLPEYSDGIENRQIVEGPRLPLDGSWKTGRWSTSLGVEIAMVWLPVDFKLRLCAPLGSRPRWAQNYLRPFHLGIYCQSGSYVIPCVSCTRDQWSDKEATLFAGIRVAKRRGKWEYFILATTAQR